MSEKIQLKSDYVVIQDNVNILILINILYRRDSYAFGKQ